jgi:hypothetical protein
MNTVLKLTNQERVALFLATSQKLGMDAVMIEKDFWVCWTLGHLFSLPGIGEHLIFKGGTSLSKVWKVIERFSEDIDISLSREWLGFTQGDDPENVPSRKQRNRKLDELHQACSDKIRTVILPHLEDCARSELGKSGWSFTVSEDDEQTILFSYQTVFEEVATPYIKRQVKIEAGARSDFWPSEEQIVRPYVAEVYSEKLTDCDAPVRVLSLERTFWEKASILHAEAHRPSDKAMPKRYSRHYSDLALMSRTDAGRKALLRGDLRDRVIAHKKIFFESAWASMETAVPGQFKLIPAQARLAYLEEDYRDMRPMYFKEPPPWSEIVDTLRALEQEINNTSDASK